MIRLVLALLATLFVTFMIAGADRGQVRYGLMATGSTPVVADTISPESISSSTQDVPVEDVVDAVYVPVETLIDIAETPSDEPTEVLAEAPVAEEPAPIVDADKLLLFVSVETANVREGPGKDFNVVDKLTRGEAVTVVSASEDPDGWTLIRIEGDGLEGYISTPLLSDQP
jgi:uncharacterized protein YgiM (DUF1202 family)